MTKSTDQELALQDAHDREHAMAAEPVELTPGHVAIHMDAAMNILADVGLPIEDRAIAYAVLHQVQLRINRLLRSPNARDALITHIVANDLRSLGPLSIRTSAVDAAYPCNDEANWDDYGVQDRLAMMARIAPDYIRHVPEHMEVRTAELGAGYASGDPVAKALYIELNELGYRTEVARRLSLAVREPFTDRSA